MRLTKSCPSEKHVCEKMMDDTVTESAHPKSPTATPQEMAAWIATLERRLEIDRVHLSKDGSVPEMVAVDPASRPQMIRDGLDGIGCRDETIRHLEVTVAAGCAKNDSLLRALESILHLCEANPGAEAVRGVMDLARGALDASGPQGIEDPVEPGPQADEILVETVMKRAWVDGFTAARDIVESCRVWPEPQDMAASKDWILNALDNTRARCLTNHPDEPAIMTTVRARLSASTSQPSRVGR